MKTRVRNYVLAILAAFPFLLVSCEDGFFFGIVGEGEIVQATLDVAEFDGFVSTIAADVYVSQGDDFEVVMEAQENIIDNMDLDWVKNGTWTIKYFHWVKHSKPVKIYITVPELRKVSLSGSGEIKGETPFAINGKLEIKISGSGRIDIDAEADEMDVNISGSGDIYLAGYTDFLDCTISGSGGIFAYDLIAKTADVHISGSGDTRVSVEDYLEATISGSGSVFYTGTPAIDSHISGSGIIKRVNN
jgi:hypothetical protein